MNFKTTSLLFGTLIAMLWLFGIVLQARKGSVEEGFVLPTLHANPSQEIDTVVLDRKGKEYKFIKTDKGWKLQVPPASQTVRADETKVNTLIREVRDARKSEEADVARNPDKYGLNQPEAKVILKAADGKEWTLNIGDRSPDKLFVYVNSSERPRDVMAIRVKSLEAVFFDNVNEMRARTLLEVTDSNAELVKLTEPGGKTPEVVLDKGKEGRWLFKQPPYGMADFEGTPGKDPGVKGLINALGSLRVENVDDFEPIGARPLPQYGLEAGKEKLRVEVKHTTGGFSAKEGSVTQTLLIGNRVKENDKEKDQYYARLEDDQAVVRVSSKKLEPVFKVAADPGSLRSRDLTQVEPDTVDAVEVKYGPDLKKEIKLLKVDPTLWKLYTGEGTGYKANETAVSGAKGLLHTLRGKGKIKEFRDVPSEEEAKKADAELGFDHPTAEVKLYVGGLEKEAKEKEKKKEKKEPVEPKLRKDAQPQVTLLFGKSKDGLVWVKRISEVGPVTRAAVPSSVLDKVAPPEGELAYLDESLPSFEFPNVVKLELVHGATKFVVEKNQPKEPEKKEGAKAEEKKETKEPPWKLVEPKDLPGRTAPDEAEFNRVLTTLTKLHAVKWVKKLDGKASKEDLAKYGLETPALTATVTVKQGDKTEDFVYKFGKEAGEKGSYAVLNKIDIVFIAPAAAVKALREADLRDHTLFSFDPAKVKDVKLVRWLTDQSTSVNLTMEHKTGDVWTSPLNDFDPEKAKKFVDDLAHLKAKKFVSFKGEPKAEQKLTGKEVPLVVEVTMDDGKTTHTLKVGALNSDKTGYFAQSNSLPGVVFVVPKEPFEPVLRGFRHFTKEGQAAE